MTVDELKTVLMALPLAEKKAFILETLQPIGEAEAQRGIVGMVGQPGGLAPQILSDGLTVLFGIEEQLLDLLPVALVVHRGHQGETAGQARGVGLGLEQVHHRLAIQGRLHQAPCLGDVIGMPRPLGVQ